MRKKKSVGKYVAGKRWAGEEGEDIVSAERGRRRSDELIGVETGRAYKPLQLPALAFKPWGLGRGKKISK